MGGNVIKPWIFAIIISFILFLLLVDWKQLAVNIYGGAIAGFFKLVEGLIAKNVELWKHQGVNLNMHDSIIFSESINIFSVSIALTLGIIFLQYLPRKLGLQFIYSFTWVLFYALFTFILKEYNMLIYIHFRFYMVTHVLLFFLSLAWFKTFWLQSRNASIFGR